MYLLGSAGPQEPAFFFLRLSYLFEDAINRLSKRVHRNPTMAYYLSRSQAARAAQKAGLTNFRTMIDPTHRPHWKFASMPGVSPAADWAKGKDFVNHVESAYIDGGRLEGIQGVLVITCRLDEIEGENIPSEFIIEPITPSLFNPDTANENRGDKRVSAQRDPSAPRAKSDVENPSKLVWEMASNMPGSTRQEVVAACVAAGVNASTASTQFYRWQKAQNK
ncbi:hypothetical protein [Aminobacter phage Erebus]|nr:hypothetical protein [Aminobacter phage Erebus]